MGPLSLFFRRLFFGDLLSVEKNGTRKSDGFKSDNERAALLTRRPFTVKCFSTL